MKKTLLICLTLLVAYTAQSQTTADSVKWERNGSLGFTFANVGLSNWAGGGESSVSLGTIFNAAAIRKATHSTWKNQIDFALGGAKLGDKDFRKTDDAIILLSQYKRKINEKFGYSVSSILRTQLLEGNNYVADPLNAGEEIAEKISNFMAPGYLSVNLGMEYSSGDVLTVSFAPAAGKFTFVMDDELSAAGAYGVDPGDKVRAEFGANMLTTLNLKLMDNITFQSNLNFFTAYDSFGNVDTNWETLLVMKVNKWFNATFGTQLIYDDDILIKGEDGNVSREIQFKHVLNLGVNFKLFSTGN
ncbi:uncharacterized protein DUF481 [Roseivirga ehrenbergii]|uniref:DUF3078 domain-containing protein n=1 Tax=Roseivirga ehrenbergii (strain DSM 102268 / JCM 13514 / KCTC 12282 / NCIMB 14502 / KMM 6017) TaxID=279360 RepID=A0A150X7M8_ROSEK|nr:DUF3078 domain-containing protein [Roseivirga ehrenbergii]KYG74700.1 hypothetical protein MB14_05715 [Roseivirga ehrenbergii]TCL13975.1 uncharacterized protein DUF481 [Roseivirga ehrenbergii]